MKTATLAALKRVSRSLPPPAQRLRNKVTDVIFPNREFQIRTKIAARYLSGQGIEIGALHEPLKVPRAAKVRYLDRMTVADLRKQYPELGQNRLVHVDIIDDGEKLASLTEASMDFVIANHVIEHTQDPLSSIENWLRVLRAGGILFLAVPHKEHTFDKDRTLTPLPHLIRDRADGPEWSRATHFDEWVRIVFKLTGAPAEAEIQRFTEMDYSIHFHVWTEVTFAEMLGYCGTQLSLPFTLELLQMNGKEFVAVLRKKNLPENNDQ